jgi:hypothetical protein
MKKRSRIKRIIIVALAAVLTLSSTSRTVLAISAENLEKFAENNIMFYDPEEGKECKKGGSLATTTIPSADTAEEMIWNWIASAGISGISDNPKAIAAIMGNYATESGYNPFEIGTYEGDFYYGLHMWRDDYGGSALKEIVVEKLGGKDYFKQYHNEGLINGYFDTTTWDSLTDAGLAAQGITKEEIAVAIDASMSLYLKGTVDGLKKDLSEYGVAGTYNDTYGNFEKYLKYIRGEKTVDYSTSGDWTETSTLGSFGLKNGENMNTDDIGQMAVAFASVVEKSGDDSYTTRKEYGEKAYERLSSKGVSTASTVISSDATNGEVYQGARYTLTEDQKARLLHVAVHENSSSLQAIKTELSQIANNSEVHFGRDAPEYYNGESLEKTVKSGWYSVSREGGAYDDLTWAGWNDDGSAKHDSGFTPSQEQLAAINEVLVNGNRTIPQTVREHTSSYKASNDGVEVTIKEDGKYDRTEFVRGKTLIEDNTSSSKWIFWSFADQNQLLGDPFGYYENQPPSDVPSYKTSNKTEDCPDDGEDTMVLPEGGMTFDQAQALAEQYIKEAQPWNGDPYGIHENDFPHRGECDSGFSDYDGCIAKINTYEPDDEGCGIITNCSEFSLYFVNRFTTIHLNGVNNGGVVVSSNLIPAGFIDGGHTPKAYAVFSRTTGKYGHTGVVVGFDGDTVITVEAGCPDWPAHADTHSMAEMTSGDYDYAYTDQFIIRSSGGGTQSGDSVLPIGNASDGEIFKDSTDIKCATGTVFIKSDQIVYREHGTININLCYLPNMRSSMWDDYKDPSGVTRPIVNSRVSGALYAAAQKYKDEHNGAEIMVNASFRDYYTQQRYYECLSANPQQT